MTLKPLAQVNSILYKLMGSLLLDYTPIKTLWEIYF
jgi:hypothetical protein